MLGENKSSLITAQFIFFGHEIPLDDVAEKLETDLTNGITDKDANERLKYFGDNLIKTPKPSVWKLYLAPLFDTLITVYLIMAVILALISIYVNFISEISIWFVMIGLNMILAIFQQFRSQKKLEALLSLSPPKAKVIRNGITKEILASKLVPGDVIEISLGDKIPADSRIIRSSNFSVNEASLTGESTPVEKTKDGSQIVELGTPIAHHINMIYLGTYVQTGNGLAVVIRTGNQTELGKIASAMSSMHTLDIPLRDRINVLGKYLTLIMVTFLVIRMLFSTFFQVISGLKLNSYQFLSDLGNSIIVAMSLIPINIPLLTTVILISGVLSMASKKIIVKELSVVETLGRCSVLCSDKTGTLTSAQMVCKLLWDTQDYFAIELTEDYDNKVYRIKDTDFENFLKTENIPNSPVQEIESGSTLELVLTSAVLNNEAKLIYEGLSKNKSNQYKVIGNPTDAALLVLALAQGFREDEIKKRYVNQVNYPFDSTLKRMSGLFKDTLEDDYMILSKGATEAILPRCTMIGDEKNKRVLDNKEKEKINNQVNRISENGYRVISLAYRSLDEIPEFLSSKEERKFIESDLTYIGFAVIHDPPRPGAREAVAQLDSAGIYPIMITGDSMATASTIARQVGILDPDEIVVEGRLASSLKDDDFFRASVFARVSPQDKEVIVSRYQEHGDLVTMTGDGVNDALAITRSDAGVAMGRTGTEVTKEAADLIIIDDSYVSLVNGVYEGRNLFEKIRVLIFFYLAINLAEGILYITSSFIPGFFLITNWQRVYIFSVVHSIPILAIIFGKDDKDIMKLKPRKNSAIIPSELIQAIISFSLIYVICMATVYILYFGNIASLNSVNFGGITSHISLKSINDPSTPISLYQVKARTMLLTVMYLTESLLVLSIRRFNKSIFSSIKHDTNWFIWIVVLISPIFHLLVMYDLNFQLFLNSFNIMVDIVPLSLKDWLIAIVIALAPITTLEFYKFIKRVKKEQI